MSTRTTPRISSVLLTSLLAAAALPAQTYTAVGPKLLRKPQLYSVFNQANTGLAVIESLSIVVVAPGLAEVAIGGRTSFTAQPGMYSFDWDLGNQLRYTGDFSGFKLGDRNPHMSHTGTEVVCTAADGGFLFSERASVNEKWKAPATVGNVPANAHTPRLFKHGGKDALAYITNPPSSKLHLCLFDRLNAILAAPYATLSLPFDRPQADYIQSAAPSIDPATGEAYGWWILGRQGFPNNGQRLHYVQDNGAPQVDGCYDTRDNILDNFAVWGGSLLVPTHVVGANPDLAAGVNRFDYAATYNVPIPSSGGRADFRLWAPPKPGATDSVGLLFLGRSAANPIPTPFGGSPLGLDPISVMLLPPAAVFSRTGFGQVSLQFPALPPNTVASMQAAYLDRVAVQLYLSNTSRAYTR